MLVVVATAFYGYQWWQEGAARSAHRSKLLADTQTELAKAEPSNDMLSELMAGLVKLPGASTSSELLAAQAEIHLRRGRAERADKLFGALAASPTALPEDQRLGARILLKKHETFGGDAVDAQTMLQQAMSMAEAAYADSQDVADLFRAWQASIRLWSDRQKEFTSELQSGHADTPQGRLAALNASFQPAQHATDVADLMLDFGNLDAADLPAELRAMHIIVTLQKGNVPKALKVAETDLNRSPGVPAIRFVAAFVLHGCAMGSAADSPDRASFKRRRDTQIAWLQQRAPEGAPERQKCEMMLSQLR